MHGFVFLEYGRRGVLDFINSNVNAYVTCLVRAPRDRQRHRPFAAMLGGLGTGLRLGMANRRYTD